MKFIKTKIVDSSMISVIELAYGIDSTNEQFTMDKLENRTIVDVRSGNTVNYSVNYLTNRYNSVNGSSLTYDKAGNLTKDKDGYTYHYDYENRIVKIKKSNDTVDVAEFSYDALGRRIEKKDYIATAKTRRYYKPFHNLKSYLF